MAKLDEIKTLREASVSSDAARAATRTPKPSPSPDPQASAAASEAKSQPELNEHTLENMLVELQHIAPITRKIGRPRLEDQGKTLKALKPWLAAGMSRSTWFNRQRDSRRALNDSHELASHPPTEQRAKTKQ
jgi:hypothetical protein